MTTSGWATCAGLRGQPRRLDYGSSALDPPLRRGHAREGAARICTQSNANYPAIGDTPFGGARPRYWDNSRLVGVCGSTCCGITRADRAVCTDVARPMSVAGLSY
jgi:hypothetical protein